MFRQPNVIWGSLVDYFIGRDSCQGLIPYNQVLWPDSYDFNRTHEFMKLEKTTLLAYVRGEIKILNTQNKTATVIVVKSKVDMVIGDQIWFKRSSQHG
jgi:hypothetical protein